MKLMKLYNPETLKVQEKHQEVTDAWNFVLLSPANKHKAWWFSASAVSETYIGD